MSQSCDRDHRADNADETLCEAQHGAADLFSRLSQVALEGGALPRDLQGVHHDLDLGCGGSAGSPWPEDRIQLEYGST